VENYKIFENNWLVRHRSKSREIPHSRFRRIPHFQVNCWAAAKIYDAIRVEIFDPPKRTCLRPDWSQQGIGYFLQQKQCSCSSYIPGCCDDG